MPPAARVGDMTSHGTALGPGPGSATVFIGGLPAWRVGADVHACPLVAGDVPHLGGMLAAGSASVLVDSFPAARQGDLIAESGPPNAIAMGCPTVLIGWAMENLFLGRGWKFPVQPDEKGQFLMSEYEEDVKESILIILSTSKGERPMSPEFGCGIHDFVFEVINSAVVGLVAESVREALERWEPRIEDLSISVRADTEKEAMLRIAVDYRVRTTNTRFNLVYPFYLTEGR